jgi:hypothetical protein
MSEYRNIGRLIGALFLTQMVVAPVVNFGLLGPAIMAPAGFLPNAAAHALQLNLAVLLLLLTGALWIAIASVALPLLSQFSRTMAFAFLALATVTFSGVVVEGIALKSMLSLSQAYVSADAVNGGFEAMAAVVRSLRNSAHYSNLLVSGTALVVFYLILLRSVLIPRVLAGFGVATAVLLIAGAIIPLLGYPTVMLMFMPVGLGQLAVVLWLLAKGFERRPLPATPALA